MNQFSEALATAQLIAEKTGVSLETALSTLAGLSSRNEKLAFNRKQFMTAVMSAPQGKAYTARELCNQLNMEMPRGSKIAAYIFKAAGWENHNSDKRDGLRLWRKP